jgi:hypothetical protein
VAAYVSSSAEARKAIDARLREKVIPEFEEYAVTKSAPSKNGWTGGGGTGNYGANYRLRTSVNYAGIWANTTGEVVYFAATRDANGEPLNGSNTYVIHFPADRLPASVVDGYWSVILVSVPDYRVVPNALERYNFNTYSALQKSADGSLEIAIGPRAPSELPASNWLPAPDGKPFSLTFRAYVPRDSVKNHQWAPAPVTKVQ